MRTRRGLSALIGIALILQACGKETTVPTNGPSTILDGQSVTESTLTQVAAAEFFSPIPFKVGVAFHAPWLELYFIDPTNPFAQRDVGSVDIVVASSIVAANESVDVALKDLGLNSITKALITASRRGIPVRVVTETDNLTSRSDFQVLTDEGISVVDDQQDGLMNNRFIVIDHSQVWTGSVDYDLAGVYQKYDGVVRIFSPELAADYTKEFDEMFVNKQFGQLIVPETPYPNVDIQGTEVEVLFSPDDFVVSRLSQLLGEARESIYFLAYAFASTELGNIIRDKAAQGVKVSGVLEFDLVDPNRVNPNLDVLEEWNSFQHAGIDVRLDSGPEIMYHKIMIIDGEIVVMGSYDFTGRAETENDENVLIIHNEDVAQKFMEEFERIRARAQE